MLRVPFKNFSLGATYEDRLLTITHVVLVHIIYLLICLYLYCISIVSSCDKFYLRANIYFVPTLVLKWYRFNFLMHLWISCSVFYLRNHWFVTKNITIMIVFLSSSCSEFICFWSKPSHSHFFSCLFMFLFPDYVLYRNNSPNVKLSLYKICWAWLVLCPLWGSLIWASSFCSSEILSFLCLLNLLSQLQLEGTPIYCLYHLSFVLALAEYHIIFSSVNFAMLLFII